MVYIPSIAGIEISYNLWSIPARFSWNS